MANRDKKKMEKEKIIRVALIGKPVGMPMIFGTGGNDTVGNHFKNLLKNAKRPFVCYIDPVVNEEAGPFPRMIGMVEQMNESIRLSNYMPTQETLRRLSMRHNAIPRDTFGPQYELMSPDEAYKKMIDAVKIPIDRFGKKEDL